MGDEDDDFLDSGITHVYPDTELDRHDLNCTSCACGCRVIFDDGGDMICIHRPFETSDRYISDQEALDIVNGEDETSSDY